MTNLVSVLTMVYNNEMFLKQCLESIDKIADQIVIVEGAWNPNLPHRSTDNSIEIATDFCKKNKKAELLFYDATRNISLEDTPTYKPLVLANEKKARQMGLDELSGDWFFLVDSDEIYKEKDLFNLRNYLDNLVGINEPFILKIPAFVFYFDFSFGTKESFQRISRILEPPKLAYTDHLAYHKDLTPIEIELPPELVFMYHYGYIGEDRVKTKMSMWNENFTDDWFESFKETTKLRSYDPINNYHLFRVAGYGGKFEQFKGTHPDCINLLMEQLNEQKI